MVTGRTETNQAGRVEVQSTQCRTPDARPGSAGSSGRPRGHRRVQCLHFLRREKVLRKGGPGGRHSDLLTINQTDLAPHVGASLEAAEGSMIPSATLGASNNLMVKR